MSTYATLADLAEAAAEKFVEICTAAIEDHGKAFVALSGGNTPKALFAALTKRRLDWSRVEFFWSDERAVGPNDSASNFAMANSALLRPIEAEHVHRLCGEAADLDQAAADYEKEIRRVLGARPFDVILLGMGDEGHTASLFPHTKALDENTRWVVANFVPKLKATRLTFTFPLINAARNVIFLVAGQDKSGAVAAVREGPRDVPEVPAQGDNAALWFLDRAAASELKGAQE